MSGRPKHAYRQAAPIAIRVVLLTLAITATPSLVHADESGRLIKSGLESVASSIGYLATAIWVGGIFVAVAGFLIAVAIYTAGASPEQSE